MKRRPSDVIAELDAQVTDFRDKLHVGMKELQQAILSGYVSEDYIHPSDTMLGAQAVQQKLERLLFYVQEYLGSRIK